MNRKLQLRRRISPTERKNQTQTKISTSSLLVPTALSRNFQSSTKKAESDNMNRKLQLRRRISPTERKNQTQTQISTSSLLVPTVGSADDSLFSDSIERLSQNREVKNDNMVDLLVQEAFQAKPAVTKEKTINSGVNRERNKNQEVEENSQIIENTPNWEEVKKTSKKSKIPPKKKLTIVSETSTDDESITEVIDQTKAYPKIHPRKCNQSKQIYHFSDAINEYSNTQNMILSDSKKDISQIQDVQSEKSILTDGITAHGDSDEAPPIPGMIRKSMHPREIEDLDGSMKDSFLKLNRETNKSISKEKPHIAPKGKKIIKGNKMQYPSTSAKANEIEATSSESELFKTPPKIKYFTYRTSPERKKTKCGANLNAVNDRFKRVETPRSREFEDTAVTTVTSIHFTEKKKRKANKKKIKENKMQYPSTSAKANEIEATSSESDLFESPLKRKYFTNRTSETKKMRYGENLNAVNDCFKRVETPRSRANDTSLSVTEVLQNIMEKFHTTLVETNQNTSKKFENLFENVQQQLAKGEKERREKSISVLTEIKTKFVSIAEKKIAGLEKSLQEMDTTFKKQLKEEVFDFIREDSKQKHALASQFKDKLKAAMDQIQTGLNPKSTAAETPCQRQKRQNNIKKNKKKKITK